MGTLLILLLAAACLAQEEPTFRAGVSFVRVDVQVVERNRTVTGLTRQDFTVLDEGTPQEITYFARGTEPLSVLLLLDVSGSMRRRVEEMAAVSREALRHLHEGDRVGVMRFSRRAEVRQDFTSDFGQVQETLRRALEDHGLGSGTAINSAILEGAAYIRERMQSEPGRRALVILTDNQSLNYRVPDEEVLRALHGADTVLNAIVTSKAKPPEAPRPGVYTNPDFTPSNVFHLASQTGGETVKADRADRSFPEMMERIRTRYSLHYRPPEAPPGEFRRIEVTLSQEARRKHPRAQVLARSGYYAAP